MYKISSGEGIFLGVFLFFEASLNNFILTSRLEELFYLNQPAEKLI
jgi:hypothetical protein